MSRIGKSIETEVDQWSPGTGVIRDKDNLKPLKCSLEMGGHMACKRHFIKAVNKEQFNLKKLCQTMSLSCLRLSVTP
jgi:hypothetical protein